MSCALNLEMREIEKAFRVANAAVIREEWGEAECALAEVQNRVGHLLREVALKPKSVPIPIAELAEHEGREAGEARLERPVPHHLART
jgi:hypothetical protein